MAPKDLAKLNKVFELSYEWNIPDFCLTKSYTKICELPKKCGVKVLIVEIIPKSGRSQQGVYINPSIKFEGSDIHPKTFSFVIQSKLGGAISVHRQEVLQTNKAYQGNSGLVHEINYTKCCDSKNQLVVIIEVTIKHDDYQNEGVGLVKLMNTILLHKEFADYTFVVNGHEVRAHKAVLAARSPYFNRIFNDNKEKAMSSIQDDSISVEAFDDFLHFLYTGEIKNLGNNLEGFSTISSRYEIKDLKKACDEMFQGKEDHDIKNAEFKPETKAVINPEINGLMDQAPTAKSAEEIKQMPSKISSQIEDPEATVAEITVKNENEDKNEDLSIKCDVDFQETEQAAVAPQFSKAIMVEYNREKSHNFLTSAEEEKQELVTDAETQKTLESIVDPKLAKIEPLMNGHTAQTLVMSTVQSDSEKIDHSTSNVAYFEKPKTVVSPIVEIVRDEISAESETVTRKENAEVEEPKYGEIVPVFINEENSIVPPSVEFEKKESSAEPDRPEVYNENDASEIELPINVEEEFDETIAQALEAM